MDNTDKEHLKEIVREVVSESHQAIAKVTSNTNGEINTKLAVVIERLDGVTNHLKQLNGKAETNMCNIEKLKNSETEIRSTITGAEKTWKSAFWIICLLIGTITSVSVYAYENDKKNLKENVDKVASDLSIYQGNVAQQTQTIINLLEKLNKKQ